MKKAICTSLSVELDLLGVYTNIIFIVKTLWEIVFCGFKALCMNICQVEFTPLNQCFRSNAP